MRLCVTGLGLACAADGAQEGAVETGGRGKHALEHNGERDPLLVRVSFNARTLTKQNYNKYV